MEKANFEKFNFEKKRFSMRNHRFERTRGCIDVSYWSWRRNVLVTTFRCNCFAILVTNIVTISYFFNWHFWDRKYNFWKFWTENVYGSMYWVGFGRLFQFKWSKIPILYLNERLPIYEKVYSVPKSMSLILFMTILGSISHIDLTRYAPFLTHYGK